jgi:hypothetical protein
MWWQVLGSNQRRLSRRFYRALPIKITYSLWPAETRFLRALSSRLNHSSTESRSGSPGMSGRHWLVAVVTAFIVAGPGVAAQAASQGAAAAPRPTPAPTSTVPSGPVMSSRAFWHGSGTSERPCRPSAFQAGHIPSWRGSCGSYALSPVAAISRWLLLLLSPLLSAPGPVPPLRCLPGAVTAPCSRQAPPPNPTAAGPDGRRVLSRGGIADHEVTPQAPLTGSGCREHSYGGFWGGHPHFLPHAPDLLIRRHP